MTDFKIYPDTPLTDSDYVLTEGAGWFRVKGFAIRIHSTDEGVIVDMFKDGEYTDTIATTYAFDHEIAEDYIDGTENHDTDDRNPNRNGMPA